LMLIHTGSKEIIRVQEHSKRTKQLCQSDKCNINAISAILLFLVCGMTSD
jgi:hypothetical protein